MIKQNLTLITALVSVALIGLVAVQLFWIQNAVELKEDEFNRNVHVALDNLVYRLDKISAAAKIQKKIKFHKQAIAERPFANLINGNIGGEKTKQDKIIVKILEELSIDSNGVVTTSIKEHQYEGDSAQSISDFPAQFKETTSD